MTNSAVVSVRKTAKAKQDRFPITVKAGSAQVIIYCAENMGKPLYTLAHYGSDGKRVRRNFRDLRKAKTEAQKAATRIHNGEQNVLHLTGAERLGYERAARMLSDIEIPIEQAVSEYLEAKKSLEQGVSLTEAARFYSRHHRTGTSGKPLTEIIDEFIAVKEQDHVSDRYLDDCNNRLGRLKKDFTGAIDEITSTALNSWLGGLGLSPRGRNNFRSMIVTLFRFAKESGYLPRDMDTEAERTRRAKDPGGDIGILVHDQMEKLLNNAPPHFIPYIAIGGFAGLRQSEIKRLDWSEVDLVGEYIEVKKQKAKTAQRRVVPIQPNLKAWLEQTVDRSGPVCRLSAIHSAMTDLTQKLEIQWPNNALRHSFASYRLAACQDAAKVALEMGNSPQMIFRHYRELVTSKQEEAWWGIFPV